MAMDSEVAGLWNQVESFGLMADERPHFERLRSSYFQLKDVYEAIWNQVPEPLARLDLFITILNVTTFYDQGEVKKIRDARKQIRSLSNEYAQTLRELIKLHRRLTHVCEEAECDIPMWFDDSLHLIIQSGKTIHDRGKSALFRERVEPGLSELVTQYDRRYIPSIPEIFQALSQIEFSLNEFSVISDAVTESRNTSNRDFIKALLVEIELQMKVPVRAQAPLPQNFYMTNPQVATLSEVCLDLTPGEIHEDSVRQVRLSMTGGFGK